MLTQLRLEAMRDHPGLQQEPQQPFCLCAWSPRAWQLFAGCISFKESTTSSNHPRPRKAWCGSGWREACQILATFAFNCLVLTWLVHTHDDIRRSGVFAIGDLFATSEVASDLCGVQLASFFLHFTLPESQSTPHLLHNPKFQGQHSPRG
jgi:hypothetical protein